MDAQLGTILKGKVTGVKNFGAFVRLEDGKSGLVHISEVSATYVEDIATHLSEGQEVDVKIISIDANGRMNLSIKQAQPDFVAPPKREHRPPREPREQSTARAKPPVVKQEPKEPAGFEDQLKQFMQDSQSRMSGVELYAGKKTRRRSR